MILSSGRPWPRGGTCEKTVPAVRVGALLLAFMLLCAPARAEYWTDDAGRRAVCDENRAGCELLYMVMTGSFDGFDAKDNLSVRVFSAALQRLLTITEDDLLHFAKEYDADEATVRRDYYIALGSCLWADILLLPELEDARATEARRVLLLFLDPSSEKDGRAHLALIRSSIDDALIETIAEATSLSTGFIEYLIYSDDWYQTVAADKKEDGAAQNAE